MFSPIHVLEILILSFSYIFAKCPEFLCKICHEMRLKKHHKSFTSNVNSLFFIFSLIRSSVLVSFSKLWVLSK